MRDETYGISIIGLAACIYGLLVLLGSSTSLPLADVQENITIAANH